MNIKSDYVLDAIGLSCPMPIVKTKQLMDTMKPGEVVEVHATDPATKVDLIAWSDGNNERYLGTFEKDNVSIHYIKKSSNEEVLEVKGKVISLDSLKEKMNDVNGTLIDVREIEEYSDGHIQDALSIPLGEFKERIKTFKKDQHLFLICRSGNRSGMAQKVLEDSGFINVCNIVPGMKEWTGKKIQGMEE